MEPDRLKSLIESGIDGAEASVQDLTGTRDHFRVVVVSPAFDGVPLVQQHRMVYDAVGDEMTNAVHALSIETRVPEA